ncbi:MAG: hypothetical protein KKC05_03745, partial [Nanoarchaeota archaeon]|nr:hypothetical protein [Nanoarchaeota archaeon]
MPHILFVSSNPKKYSHIEPAKNKGYVTSLVKTYPTPEDYKTFDNVIKADLFDLQDVLNKVARLNKKIKIDGVLTRFEPYTPLVGSICESLSLQGPRLEPSINCRDKKRMRIVLGRAGIKQPRFFDPRKDNIPEDSYPLLLKPTRGAKSRYII